MLDQAIGLLLFGLGIKNQVDPTVLGNKTEDRIERQEKREEERENNKEAVKSAREEAKNTLELKKKALEELREQKKQELETLRETQKQELESKKEEFEVQREAFKQKLETIGQEKKKSLVLSLDSKFIRINSHITDQMQKHLDKIIQILDKVKERTAKALAAGKDTSAVDEQLVICDGLVAETQAAIDAQKANEYVIEIASGSALRRNVGSTRQELQSDLKEVHATLKDARKCVSDTLKLLAKISGNKGSGIATPSATVAPTSTTVPTPTDTPIATPTDTPTPTVTL